MVSVPVGLSHNLHRGRVMRALVHGFDLVVWRGQSGKLSAWNNRCPHRGMRLSHGFVRGDTLACVYHGWNYNERGACQYLPAHPDLKPSKAIQLDVFHAADHYGLVWVDLVENADIPDLPDNLVPLRSIQFDCNLNVLDACWPLFEFYTLDGKLSKFNVQSLQAHVWIGTIDQTQQVIYVCAQNLPDDKCQLHVLIDNTCSIAEKKHMSRLFEGLRRFAESQKEAQV